MMVASNAAHQHHSAQDSSSWGAAFTPTASTAQPQPGSQTPAPSTTVNVGSEIEGARFSAQSSVSFCTDDPEKGKQISPTRRCCEAFVEVIILLNAIQMGICPHPEDSDALMVFCSITEHAFTAIFLIEFLIKRWFLGKAYWDNRWNWLDFTLVVVAVVDQWIMQPILLSQNSTFRNFLIVRIFRINRLLRLLRIVGSQNQMKLLLRSMVESLQAMIWVGLLMLLLIYCSSIFCVISFRDVEMESMINFGTIGSAMFTMFTLAILADWTELINPVMEEHQWAALFFVGFIIIATLMILNLLIGVVTERTTSVQAEYEVHLQHLKELEHMEGVKKIANLIFSTQDDETITREEMQDMVTSEEYGGQIHDLVKDVSLPVGYEVTDCHAMFDRDSSGTITQKEFEHGMKRLIFGTDFQRSFMIQAAIADVMVFNKGFEDRMSAQVTAEFAKLRQELNIAPAPSPPPADDGVSNPKSDQHASLTTSFCCSVSCSDSCAESLPASHTRRSEKLTKEAQQKADERLVSCQSIVDRLREPLSMYLAEAVIKDVEVLPAGPGYDRLPRPDFDSDGKLIKKGGVIGGQVCTPGEPAVTTGQGSGRSGQPPATVPEDSLVVAPNPEGDQSRRFGFMTRAAYA